MNKEKENVALMELPESKKAEYSAMAKRMEQCLLNEEIKKRVENDFVFTFSQLGLAPEEATKLCARVFDILLETNRALPGKESDILNIYKSIKVVTSAGELNLVQIIESKLQDRAETIVSQIAPEIEKHFKKDTPGLALDFGAGDGQVTQKLQDSFPNLKFEGVDVRAYSAIQGVKVPITKFDGQHVPAQGQTYDLLVMTNVAHHEKDNERILEELSRIAKPGAILIVIETVPVGGSEPAIKLDHERTFMNDYLYNRLFHNADVPVPGTFETPARWIQRFESQKWQMINSVNLGIDQPTIQDTHHLLVFKKL